MKDIPKDMWRNSAYRYDREKKQPYWRLRGSKMPYLNLYGPYYSMLVKTCDDAEIGRIMKAIYEFIYDGSGIWWYDEKKQNIWEDILTKINEKADWWFKIKNKEEQQNKKLNITKDDINEVFKVEGDYVGRIKDE